MGIKRSLAVVPVMTLLFTGAPQSAQAWQYTYGSIVKFVTSYSGGYYKARIYDTACDGVPVRGQYTRGSISLNVYNGNGCNTDASTPENAIAINSVILCNDYSFGDDCSPKHYG